MKELIKNKVADRVLRRVIETALRDRSYVDIQVLRDKTRFKKAIKPRNSTRIRLQHKLDCPIRGSEMDEQDVNIVFAEEKNVM